MGKLSKDRSAKPRSFGSALSVCLCCLCLKELCLSQLPTCPPAMPAPPAPGQPGPLGWGVLVLAVVRYNVAPLVEEDRVLVGTAGDGVPDPVNRLDEVSAAVAPYGVPASVFTIFRCLYAVGIASAQEQVGTPEARHGIFAVVAKELIASVGAGILGGQVVAEHVVGATAAHEQVVVLLGVHEVRLVGADELVWLVGALAVFCKLMHVTFWYTLVCISFQSLTALPRPDREGYSGS